MTSLKNVARDLGVSPATVSNALSGKGRVSAALAEKIRLRAAEIGYRPSLAARALKTGRSGILGLVMPDLTNPLFPQLAQNIETAADEAGFGVLIADSRGSAEGQTTALDRLLQRGVDGVVIVPCRGTSADAIDEPMAVINAASDPRNTISSDHRGGGALIAGAMLDLGHRDMMLLGAHRASQVQQDRINGMIAGLDGRARHRIAWAEDGFPDLAHTARDGVTAILATSDLLALRALGHAGQEGLRVPSDLSISGFDNLPLATEVRPMLTTVAQDAGAVARAAIAHLAARLEGRPGTTGQTVPMRLVPRETTGAAPD